MGTTLLNRSRGETTAEFFVKEFGATYAAAVRATATTSGAFYAVVEYPASDKPILVPNEIGMVRYCWVVRIGRGSKSFGNFSYSQATEFMGPRETDCPARLLDMLSPLKDEPRNEGPTAWARGWRLRCRERLAIDKALTVGQEFTSDREVTFRDFKASRFKLIERRGKRMRFLVPNGVVVRLTADIIADLKVAA